MLSQVRTLLETRRASLTLSQVAQVEAAVVASLRAGDVESVRGLCVQLFGQGARHPAVIVQAASEFLDAGNFPQTRRFWSYLETMTDPDGLVAAARCEYLGGRRASARDRIARALAHPASTPAHKLAALEAMAEAGDPTLERAMADLGLEADELALASHSSSSGAWMRALYRLPPGEQAARDSAGLVTARHPSAAMWIAFAARAWFRGDFTEATQHARKGMELPASDRERAALAFLLAVAEARIDVDPNAWPAMPAVLHGDENWMRQRERASDAAVWDAVRRCLAAIRETAAATSPDWLCVAAPVITAAAVRSADEATLAGMLKRTNAAGRMLPEPQAAAAVDALLQAGNAAVQLHAEIETIAAHFPADPGWLLRRLRLLRAAGHAAGDMQRVYDSAPEAARSSEVRIFLADAWHEAGSPERVLDLCESRRDHFVLDDKTAARIADAQIALGREVDAPGWTLATPPPGDATRVPLPVASKDPLREERWHALLAEAEALAPLPEAPRVSILVPIFNGDLYFIDAVESIVRQTFSSWELLIIDDGSQDAAPHRAADLARACGGRVRVLTHPGRVNRGLPASRNLGIAHSRGDYIAMLDIDDVWRPDKLATQVKLLDAHPECAMAYGPITYWYGWTGRPEDMRRDFVSPHGTRHDMALAPPDQLRHVIMHRDGFPIPTGAMVRRAVLDADNIRFDESFGMYEDVVFLSQIAVRHPVYLHSQALELYRQHRGSFTSMAQRTGEYSPHKANAARERWLRWLDTYLEQSGLDPKGELRSLIPGQLDSMY